MTATSRVLAGMLIASWTGFFLWEQGPIQNSDVVAPATSPLEFQKTATEGMHATASEEDLAKAVEKKIAENNRRAVEQWHRDDRGRTEKALSDPLHLERLSRSLRLQFDGEYGDLFSRLHLPHEKLQKLQAYLVDRRMTEMDIGARANDLSGEQQAKLRAEAKREIEAEIGSSLGCDVLDQLLSYEQSIVARIEVGRINQRLGYAATPLTKDQTIVLEQIVSNALSGAARNAPVQSNDHSRSAFPYSEILALTKESLTDQQRSALANLFSERKHLEALNEKMTSP
jgi:hypothetical protein